MAITHKALFDKLRDDRVIQKCRQYAHWTLPQLMADYCETRDGGLVVERDYQEIGALLTNNLSAKLTSLLFPNSRPFFQIDVSNNLRRQAKRKGVSEARFNASMATLEMDAVSALFKNASYNQLVLLLKHLIVTGNALLYRDTVAQRLITYGLQSFAVRRDGMGRVLDAVLREYTYVEALPWEMQEYLKSQDRQKYSRPECQVELFTRVHRVVTKFRTVYEVTQEVDTHPVGEKSTYPEHLCPYIFPTWNLIPGEHYGRGMVEDYAGGFAKLSDLSEAHALYSIEMMRVVHMVNPGSGTDIDRIATAETGEYVAGDPDSVKASESGDARKMEQTRLEISEVFGRLAKAFMYMGNTRNAERVTMFELAQDAREAESTLGGTYSALSENTQVPLAHIAIIEARPEILEGIITEDIRLNIIAGIPALGRSGEVQNLLAASQEAATIVPALKQLDRRIDVTKLMDVIYGGRSIDVSALFYPEDQQRQIDNASQQVSAAQGQVADALASQDQLSAIQQVSTTGI